MFDCQSSHPHFRLWSVFGRPGTSSPMLPTLLPQPHCHLAGILLALVVASTEHPGRNHVVIGLAADVLLDDLHIHLLQDIANVPWG